MNLMMKYMKLDVMFRSIKGQQLNCFILEDNLQVILPKPDARLK